MTEPVPFGKYTLLERLASGPVADIYRAVTRTADGTDLPVVVKQIRPEAARDQSFLASFVDEARVASLLEHPNIARTYEWGRHEDSLFIAMEYIEGTNLASLMQSAVEQGLRFPPTIGIHIVCEVLIGLVYAHNLKDPYGNPLGLVHRDVSPPNIVLSSSGEVKIVDFGLAKVTSKIQATMPGVFGGKFTYMAPEQIRRKNVDHRADIFSCGVVLYELLTGQKLKSAGDSDSVRSIVDSARTRPPSSVHADIPVELDALLARAMAEDPASRPASAASMAQELNDFIQRWDRQVDADAVSSFILDTLSGRAKARKESVGFAFGEATSAWMARGEQMNELVRVPMAGTDPDGGPETDLETVREPHPQLRGDVQELTQPTQPSSPAPGPESLLDQVPVRAGADDLLSQVPGAPLPAPEVARVGQPEPAPVPSAPAERQPVMDSPTEPHEPLFAPPQGGFAKGETVMAIQAGGLGKGRQLKTLLWVLVVAAAVVLAVVFIVKHLTREDDFEKKPVAKETAATGEYAGPVEIRTEPEGALVFIDGDPVKPEGSPPRIMGLRAGRHRVKLLLPGHLPWEEDITFEAKKPLVIEQKLQERLGRVTITSKPASAHVFLNGKRVGKTPKTLTELSAARTHKVMLKLKRHDPEKFNIEPSDWPDDPAEELRLAKDLKRSKRRKRRRQR